MKANLRNIAAKLIQFAKEEESNGVEKVELPSPAGVFAPSDKDSEEEEEVESPEARALPFAAGRSGETPVQGRRIGNVVEGGTYNKRCKTCLGIFPMKCINDPEGEAANARLRGTCTMCGRKCIMKCGGCRRYLCLMPPQNGKIRVIQLRGSKRTATYAGVHTLLNLRCLVSGKYVFRL